MNSPPTMQRAGNVRIVTFPGSRIGADLGKGIADNLEAQTATVRGGHVLLDFRNIESIGSEDLGALVALHKKMTAEGGQLTLFNLNAHVYEVFVVTRLQTILAICQEETLLSGT